MLQQLAPWVTTMFGTLTQENTDLEVESAESAQMDMELSESTDSICADSVSNSMLKVLVFRN